MDPVDVAEKMVQSGGRVHLIGAGGIGMAGVAFLLKERGFEVSGCDLQENRQTEWLTNEGIPVADGHDASHITSETDWLIRSTAVPDDHPVVVRAGELGVTVSRRGEVLPALLRDRFSIAVSGTHGKTTTTALIAQTLGCGYCIGGEVAGFAGVARDGEVLVVEADESDGTVAGYSPDIAVITNIEYDHMEHHDSEAAFIGCFERFVAKTKERVYYCGTDPIARRVCEGNPKCEPYFLPDGGFELPLPGLHNQWNASAALAVAGRWLAEEQIRDRLAEVKPLRRRFETVYSDDQIRIVSDYAHHPTEIAALIQTAQELAPKRLIGVFQPHRYTRTLALGKNFPPAFDGLEKLWLVPVYAASEAPMEGGTSRDLQRRFGPEWAGRLFYSDTLGEAWNALQDELVAGDLLLIIGAGDIENIAEWARSARF